MSTSTYEKYINMPLSDLIAYADKIRRSSVGTDVDVCGIVNAKSGACSENCKFCAQSVHHNTSVDIYPLENIENIIKEAHSAKQNGAKRFSIVTSGNKLTEKETKIIAEAVKEVSQEIGLETCASLGALNQNAFKTLKDAGLKRYHHNIETSERFYGEIVSTHDFSERINTVLDAKQCGLDVCSGGIVGLGETWNDRISMAITLKNLEVDSVLLNFLVPIKGTPLENMPKMTPNDAIRTIAIFRIILGGISLTIAAGRESVLKDFQGMMFMAGANGIMIGGYLTVKGRSVEEDSLLLDKVKEIWKNQ